MFRPNPYIIYGLSRSIAKKLSTSSSTSSHVCIVGSGPAGFYTAQKILKSHPDAQIDIYERLPVPFGLVRYGVAPDHPEVKNCINAFTEVGRNERVSFFGNIAIGKDIDLDQLREAYHAVVLAYGAAKDRPLSIPGESLPNVVPARRLVGWYNGLPEDSNLDLDLDVEEVAVIGQGNVAVDVARILLTPVDALKNTDIPEPVLAKLASSRVRSVALVGRRGPSHVAFTVKELREMVTLPGARPTLREGDIRPLGEIIHSVPRPRKRLLELLYKTGVEPTDSQRAEWRSASKEWSLRFLSSPLEVVSNQEGTGVKGIKVGVNRMEGGKAVLTGETEFVNCGLVVRSIGYTCVQLHPSIPFDEAKGIVPNQGGRVVGHKGLYVSGWLATGPVGVIVSTMQSGGSTGKAVVDDLSGVEVQGERKEGKEGVIRILADKKIRPVSFCDWGNVDRYEVEEGRKLGKAREKVTDAEKMLHIAHTDHML